MKSGGYVSVFKTRIEDAYQIYIRILLDSRREFFTCIVNMYSRYVSASIHEVSDIYPLKYFLKSNK
jgi:hypothetical protein